jgi:hypothetical protein
MNILEAIQKYLKIDGNQNSQEFEKIQSNKERLVNKILNDTKNICVSNQNFIYIFHLNKSNMQMNISMNNFKSKIEKMIKFEMINIEIYNLAFYLIKNYLDKNYFWKKQYFSNFINLFAVSTCIANKYIQDIPYTNITYAEFFGIPIKLFGESEIYLLSEINFGIPSNYNSLIA